MIRLVQKIIMWLVFIFLYAPIIVLIVFSFNSGASQTAFAGFSLRWYAELFSDRSIMTALWNTLIIAAVSSVASTLIGTMAAVGIFGMGRAAKNIVINITYLPLLNPDIIMAVSMMLVFTMLSLPFGLLTLCIAHITFNIPYVILSVMPKLRQMNMSVYEAALDLGCRPGAALRRVVLPQIMPGVITGLLLAFTLSIDDFIISYFTKGSGAQTLPIVIYSMTRRKVTPKINALSTIMFLTVLALLVVINLRKDKNKEGEEKRI